MITYFILNIFLSILSYIIWPITSLPDVVLPLDLASSITTAGGFISTLYGFAPHATTALGAVISAYIIFELAIWVYKMIKWVYQKIPGIN